MDKLKKYYPLILSPLLTAAVLLFVFYLDGLYPFGEGSVSWCDMNQQVIPLLIDLKDILAGKDGLFLNMHNAGGMDFFGVFCFFLSNPFSFLAALVDKENMILFVNILVILKLSLCALTASLYFVRRKSGLDSVMMTALSMMYALCGFGMLFYQNIMWLDIMYMFPILMIGLEKLTEQGKNILYIVALSVIMIMNFYICYMVVVFILLYMMIYVLSEKDKNKLGRVCVKFIFGSVISAMMTAVVWLTSYIEVSQSGRGESVTDTLRSSGFVSHYETVFPLLYCTSFIFVIIIYTVIRKNYTDTESKNYFKLFLLTLIPFLLEPVNIMWHTGSYMSFPARYGFITIFIGLICCTEAFKERNDITDNDNKDKIYSYFAVAASVIMIFVYGIYCLDYIKDLIKQISAYTSSLWGNSTSFDLLTKLFVLSVICYSLLLFLYKRKLFDIRTLSVLIVIAFVFESAGNIRVYMTGPYINNPTRTETFQNITEMADRIDDDGFYRVMTDKKITDYNMIGALGYNSLSHYTSLTDEDFMFQQKHLGYTTVWMEAGSLDGTELTNGLYSVKYKILNAFPSSDSVYSNDLFTIEPQEYYLGLGLICDNDFSNSEYISHKLTRAQTQQYLYSEIFGDRQLIYEYHYDNNDDSIIYSNGKYNVSDGATVSYNIYVSGRQSLYADCFDVFSNSLSESYFKTFKVVVNGEVIEKEYPRTIKNGVLKLGEFENEYVSVTMTASKNISCYSFGVFGLDLDVLSDSFNNARCANLDFEKGKITGTVSSESGKTCLLAIPYNDGITVRINGEKVQYRRALSDLVAFDLKDGENNIEISMIPKGFIIGAIISAIGLAAFAAYVAFRKKLKPVKYVSEICVVLTMFAAFAAFAMIYIFPVLISFI